MTSTNNNNQPSDEFEKQFQDDLEKATALSLETLALDQFRRNKLQNGLSIDSSTHLLYHSNSHNTTPATTTRPRPGSFTATISDNINLNLQTSSSSGSIAPPPIVPPRRHSEIKQLPNTVLNFNQNSTGGKNYKTDETDLILFVSPTATTATANEITDPHTNFVHMVDEIYKLNAKLEYPTNMINNPNGMQIVPYFQTQQSQIEQPKKPLTVEELNKLYNMNNNNNNNGIQSPFVQSQQQHPMNVNTQSLGFGNISQLQQQPSQLPSHPQYIPYAQYNQSMSRTTSFDNTHFINPLQSTSSASSSSSSSQLPIHHNNNHQPQPMQQNLQQPSVQPAVQPSQFGISSIPSTVPKQTIPLIPARRSRDNISSPLTVSSNNNNNNNNNTSSGSNTTTSKMNTLKSPQNDLIDLNNGATQSSGVSVLEAFDPLLMGDSDDKDDNESDCTTSYYSDYDPFDYLYSGGTQYSDPVYEAVNKLDRTQIPMQSSGPLIGWNIPPPALGFNIPEDSLTVVSQPPPPLPPRNSSSPSAFANLPFENDEFFQSNDNDLLRQQQQQHRQQQINKKPLQQQQQPQQQMLDRRKIARKLYENIVINKKYDPELVAFYTMVKELRAEYKCTDELTNIGYVIAAEIDNQYPADISIKLLVHPSLTCMLPNINLNNTSSNNNNTNSQNQMNRRYTFTNGPDTVSGSISNDENKGQFDGYGPPVAFTCDISTTVDHVIMHVFCGLEGQICGTVNDYMLKPIGITEWLSSQSKLSQLECVHNSLKLEQDVHLGFCSRLKTNMKNIVRTHQDDVRDNALQLEDVLANEPVDTINYDNLIILLETLEDEISKLESATSHPGIHNVFTCSGVVQAVKMICALLGSIDTLEITQHIDDLKNVCASGQTIYYSNNNNNNTNSISSSANASNNISGGPSTINNNNNGVIIDLNYGNNKLDIVSETGDYAEIALRPKTVGDQIKYRCNQLRESVQILIETYSHAFRVDFCVNTMEYFTNPVSISNVPEPVMIHILCLHRIPPNWRHDDYMLGAQMYHGTKYISEAIVTQCSNERSGIFPRLKFDTWLNFETIPICTLPRESRLVLVLYGCISEPTADGSSNTSNTNHNTNNHTNTNSSNQTNNNSSNNNNNNNNNDNSINPNDNSIGPERKIAKIELGWCSVQFFDFERNMIQGSFMLPLWPPTTDKYLGPAPARGTHPYGDHCPVLSIEIPNYGGHVKFPESPKTLPIARRLDFQSLDRNLQQELIDTAEQGYPSALDKREVLWEKRYYLQELSHALPKVLHAAHSWDFASLVDLHSLVHSWKSLTPLQALELLLPRYPDMEVRLFAVKWISSMKNDQLVDFLPQLLQGLKHDTYEGSPMAKFLLRRALESPRIAHHLYWLLVHSLPGDSPQNTLDANVSNPNDVDETIITQARYNRRNQMMLRSLLAISGEKLAGRFLAQNMMCKSIADVAVNVKCSKESMRQKALIQGLEIVNQLLTDRPTALPLGPGQEVHGVNARNSNYFNSNTLPLKINFYGCDGMLLPAIFKAGDDLQQDMLTIQLVRMMNKLWLKNGLDLKMVTFNCVPTGYKKGMIEMITDAETLRKIQVEWGLTGTFKDKPISEWLARQNPSQLEYQRAVYNFTVSCAGYSVATYILGICDRHNDNIMLKTSGHLFHIDFGKFLGDAQMFGSFKRDRAPFVLTPDMAYVINGGDRPSSKFQHFVDLCCKAFNIVRQHGDLILHMLALMATAGIPGVTADAVNYVRNALLPGQSNPEAAASFAKMIHISLKSWFTQINFFLHSLAQLKFSTDGEGNGELLSFVPRTYTLAQDGRLKSVTVHGFQKRYELEKYYTYILKVTRQNQPDPAYLFRPYKEFIEFHQKLCLHFPLAKLHSLPSGIHVGRSNIKTVAERRLPEIRLFLISLFNSADEIAHSDLVYTFFHPLLRDQQEQDIHVAKVKESTKQIVTTERVSGEIKLSLQYHRDALIVMIHHARSLPPTTSGQEPNTYVKAYLKPDPSKATKRKTKVIKKNCFPSFMETLEYRMPLEFIQNKVLQVTVWSNDTLQENEFLGGIEINLSELDLREELVKWFTLGYLTRS